MTTSSPDCLVSMPRGQRPARNRRARSRRKNGGTARGRVGRERSRSDGPLSRAGCSFPGETGARRRRGLPVLRCLCARRRRSAGAIAIEWHCDHAGSAGRVSARDRPRSRRPSEVAARDWADRTSGNRPLLMGHRWRNGTAAESVGRSEERSFADPWRNTLLAETRAGEAVRRSWRFAYAMQRRIAKSESGLDGGPHLWASEDRQA